MSGEGGRKETRRKRIREGDRKEEEGHCCIRSNRQCRWNVFEVLLKRVSLAEESGTNNYSDHWNVPGLF